MEAAKPWRPDFAVWQEAGGAEQPILLPENGWPLKGNSESLQREKTHKNTKKETEEAPCCQVQLRTWICEENGILPSPALGRAEASCVEGRSGSVRVSSLLLRSCLQTAFPRGPAHSSSPSLTLSRSRGKAGCWAGPPGMELWEESGQTPPHCLLLSCHLVSI